MSSIKRPGEACWLISFLTFANTFRFNKRDTAHFVVSAEVLVPAVDSV